VAKQSGVENSNAEGGRIGKQANEHALRKRERKVSPREKNGFAPSDSTRGKSQHVARRQVEGECLDGIPERRTGMRTGPHLVQRE